MNETRRTTRFLLIALLFSIIDLQLQLNQFPEYNILTYFLFYGMDVVSPGGTFSCQGRGKVPRGSGTRCAKRACCIYLLNTNKRWAPEIPRFYYQQNALQKKHFFENPNDEKVCRWVGGPKTTAGSMKSAPPTHPQTINILGSSQQKCRKLTSNSDEPSMLIVSR